MMASPRIDRRHLLRALAFGPTLAALTMGLRAKAETAGLIATDVCVVQPQTTEGPFYLGWNLLREIITEGRAGLPLGNPSRK